MYVVRVQPQARSQRASHKELVMKVFLWVIAVVLAAVVAAGFGGVVPATYAGWPVKEIFVLLAGATWALLLTDLVCSGLRKASAKSLSASASAGDAGAARSEKRAAQLDARQAQVARNTATLQAAVLEQPAAADGNTVARVDGSEGRYIEVEKGNNAETGALEVTVTAYNYSGSKFSTHVHNRLLKIKGVKWDNPKNLGTGETNRKRQIKGAVVSASMSDVLAGIAAIK
jgi:hypothetical protein